MERVIKTRSPFYLQFESLPAEQGATNFCKFSEAIGFWGLQNMSSVQDDTSAPDGNSTTADKITRTSTASSYAVTNSLKPEGTQVRTYTASVFVKQIDSRYASVSIQGDYPNRVYVQYDFENRVINKSLDFEDMSVVNTQVEEYNGWVRIGITFVSDDRSSLSLLMSPMNDEIVNSFADSSNDTSLYAWGAQINLGTSLTSYIPNLSTGTSARATTTSATEREVTLNLSIWEGMKDNSDFIDNPTYSIAKNPTDGMTTFEISEFVRDFIKQNSNTSAGTVWVYAILSDNDTFIQPYDRQYLFLATEGYNTRKEGVATVYNSDSAVMLAQTNTDITIPEGMTINIPVYSDEEGSYSIDSGSDVSFSTLINTQAVSSLNTERIHNIPVSSTDSVVEIKHFGDVIHTINVSVADCSKYPANMLTFVNKFGAKQDLYFNMKSTQRVTAKSDNFKRNTLDFSDLTANSLKHATKRVVNTTNETFKLNTGFITENNAQAIEELLVSEYVWLTQEDSTVIPVNITDNNITRKTHLNDKLIQYTINVEASAPYLNNFR